MKVFLSHSTKDKDFTQQLSAAILGSGSETWLCELDVAMQANFVAEIEKGLKWCEIALLIWSPDAASSHWTEAEWTSVLARQVAEQKTRLGIVLLRDHPLPELLRTTNYIDARTDPRQAFRRVVGWLEHRESVKRFLGLPEYRPQDFVGRTVYLEKLRTTFSGDPVVFFLNGEPGTGKSTLALQFAWNAQKDFDAVVFQTCGQRTLDAITAELVDHLPIDAKTLPPDQQRKAAKDWLRQRESLLILDDVWPTDGKIEIREFEPGPTCSVLYTSRQKSLPGLVAKQASKVEKFTGDEALQLFHTYLDEPFSQQEVESNKKPLLDFAARVEMLPIAVSVGASLLRDMSATPLSDAVSELRVDALNDGAQNVNALFSQAIDLQPERERKLLQACAVCVQEGFWLPLAADIAGLTKEDANKAANALVNGSLLRVLDRDRRRFQLHALLREQLRSRAGADGLAQLQQRHAEALERLFKGWEKNWRECRECLTEIPAAADHLHLRKVDESAKDLAFNDRGWALGFKGFSLAYRVGELDLALRPMLLQESLWAGDGDNPRAKNFLQASYGNQALVLQDWGRLDEALVLHKKKEAICLELGNKDSLSKSYSGQGNVLKQLGQLDEAMALYKKEEKLCSELGDKDGLQRSYGNQALILKDLGRLDEALALHKKEEAICIELGDESGLQGSRLNQARILIQQRALPEAHDLLRSAEEYYIAHGLKRDLSYCYWNWADLEAVRGDRAAQIQKLQQSLALFTELNMPIERDAVQTELAQLNSTEN